MKILYELAYNGLNIGKFLSANSFDLDQVIPRKNDKKLRPITSKNEGKKLLYSLPTDSFDLGQVRPEKNEKEIRPIAYKNGLKKLPYLQIKNKREKQ